MRVQPYKVELVRHHSDNLNDVGQQWVIQYILNKQTAAGIVMTGHQHEPAGLR